MQVLILVHIEVMERVLVRWVPITESEVDGDTQLNLTAAKNVLQKGVSLVEIQIFKSSILVLTPALQLVLQLALTKHGDVASDVSQVDMFTALLRLEEFDSDFTFRVLVGQF